MLNTQQVFKEEYLDCRLPESFIPPLNVPVPPIAEPQSNLQTCNLYYSYDIHHEDKLSDRENNSWQE